MRKVRLPMAAQVSSRIADEIGVNRADALTEASDLRVLDS